MELKSTITLIYFGLGPSQVFEVRKVLKFGLGGFNLPGIEIGGRLFKDRVGPVGWKEYDSWLQIVSLGNFIILDLFE